MKKLLLSTLVLTGLSAQAQYTPASGDMLPGGVMNQSYSATVSATFPASTTISGSQLAAILPAQLASFASLIPASLNVTVTGVALTVAGLPTGLNSSCPAPATGCNFSPSVAGSIQISGAPTAGGASTVTVSSSTTGSTSIPNPLGGTVDINLGGTVSIPGLGDIPIPAMPGVFDATYNLFVVDPNGIEDLDLSSFGVIPAYPNPTSGTVNLAVSSPKGADVKVSVVDMQGRMVYSASHTTKAGANVIALDLGLATGVYSYSLAQDGKTVNGRFAVSR